MLVDEATILGLADWSAPKEVSTRNGPRRLYTAAPTERFSEAWKSPLQPYMKQAGLSWTKDKKTGDWQICWWRPLDQAVTEQRQARVVASKASSLDLVIPCPPGLAYLPFQLAGIHYMLGTESGNALNGDVPGLGKTIQFLGLVNAREDLKWVLVICPKTLKINWLRETTKWLVRPTKIAVADNVWPADANFVIVSYEGAQKFHGRIMARTWDLLGVDEAHWIKNRKTKRAISILGKAAAKAKGKPGDKGYKPAEESIPGIQARHHQRMTGTPIVNKPVELHPVISDLDPAWANFWNYAQRYCNAHQKSFGRKTFWDFSGASNLDELQQKLRETVMVRRTKEEVLKELPRKVRRIILLSPETAGQRQALQAEADQLARHERILQAKRAAVELSKAEEEEAYQKAVYELRQAEAVSFTEISAARHATSVQKVPLVLAHLEELLSDSDEKVIVAAHHHDVMDLLLAGSVEREWRPVVLHGGVNEKDRQKAVDAFQADPLVRVFVAGIQAAGVGITLTASSTVVFAEYDWVPGTNLQMEDRAHRIGQVDTVLCDYLVMDGSTDVRELEVTIGKQGVIDAALDKDHPARQAPVIEATWRDPEAKLLEKPVTHGVTPAKIEAEALAVRFTAGQKAAILEGLRRLAGMDVDRALVVNSMGFNKVDGDIGHSLASQDRLSDRQAVIGLKLVNRYRRQLPEDLVGRAKGEEVQQKSLL